MRTVIIRPFVRLFFSFVCSFIRLFVCFYWQKRKSTLVRTVIIRPGFFCVYFYWKKRKSMLVRTVILSVPFKHSVDPDLTEIYTNGKRT